MTQLIFDVGRAKPVVYGFADFIFGLFSIKNIVQQIQKILLVGDYYSDYIGAYRRFIGADICTAFPCSAAKHHHKAGLQLIKTVFYSSGGTGVMNPLQAGAEAFDVFGIVQSSCDNGVSPDRPFGMLNKILRSVSLRKAGSLL